MCSFVINKFWALYLTKVGILWANCRQLYPVHVGFNGKGLNPLVRGEASLTLVLQFWDGHKPWLAWAGNEGLRMKNLEFIFSRKHYWYCFCNLERHTPHGLSNFLQFDVQEIKTISNLCNRNQIRSKKCKWSPSWKSVQSFLRSHPIATVQSIYTINMMYGQNSNVL